VRHCLVQRIVKAYERYNELNGSARQLSLKLDAEPAAAVPELSAPAPTAPIAAGPTETASQA
jgi:hypothetical protein